MAIDPNSAVGQTQTIYSSLASYFSDMTKYLSNGGSCPDFNTYVTGIDYSELHRLTALAQEGSSNYPNGSAIETIHHATGILREFGLRTKSKADYYADAAGEATDESNYYSTTKVSHVNSISGIPPVGGSL